MRGEEMFSTRHGEVYHAAHGCQAASLPLTAVRLRGQKKACQVESEKTARVFAAQSADGATSLPGLQLRGTFGMQALSLLKCCRLIRAMVEPHRVDDTYPDIC